MICAINSRGGVDDFGDPSASPVEGHLDGRIGLAVDPSDRLDGITLHVEEIHRTADVAPEPQDGFPQHFDRPVPFHLGFLGGPSCDEAVGNACDRVPAMAPLKAPVVDDGVPGDLPDQCPWVPDVAGSPKRSKHTEKSLLLHIRIGPSVQRSNGLADFPRDF